MFPLPAIDLEHWHAQATLWRGRACDSEQVDGYRVLFGQRQALTAAMMRTAAALHAGAPAKAQEFVGDDLALAMGVSPLSGKLFVQFAVAACALPGLVESMESGKLSESHVRVVLRELDLTVADASQRAEIVRDALARAADRGERRGWVLTPYELGKTVRALVLLRDVDAAQRRRDKATADRGVFGAASRDGQGYLSADGPVEQVAAMLDAVRARAEAMGQIPGEARTLDQRMFDACYALLTAHPDGGRLEDGQQIRGVEVAVLTPFSVLAGGDHELAEIAGFGPILPATARELAAGADRLRRVCIDAGAAAGTGTETDTEGCTDSAAPGAGRVIAVDDAVPGPGRVRPSERLQATPDAADRLTAAVARMATEPVVLRDLTSNTYRIPGRISRFVKARDRTCVFPGCSRSARFTDADHREPWPHGPTDADNLQCLCRHHHRAKQACYEVSKLPDGSYRWTTRTGHAYERRPQGF